MANAKRNPSRGIDAAIADALLTPKEKATLTDLARKACLLNDGARIDQALDTAEVALASGQPVDAKEGAKLMFWYNELCRFREMGDELLGTITSIELRQILEEEGLVAEPVHTPQPVTKADLALIRASLID